MGKTIYTLNNVHTQIILPSAFKIKTVNCKKKSIKETNYANAGYFAGLSSGSTIPVGHLVIDGKVITNTATQATWLNTSKHTQSTIVVHKDNSIEMIETNDITKASNVKYAISGIPILKNGLQVKMTDIKKEGWFGNECYNTWHTFLGIQQDKLLLVGAKVNFNLMPYLMDVLGLRNCIKLDGGGSFIMHSDTFTEATTENRVINNIITW